MKITSLFFKLCVGVCLCKSTLKCQRFVLLETNHATCVRICKCIKDSYVFIEPFDFAYIKEKYFFKLVLISETRMRDYMFVSNANTITINFAKSYFSINCNKHCKPSTGYSLCNSNPSYLHHPCSTTGVYSHGSHRGDQTCRFGH